MNIPETFFSVSEELRLFGLSCIFGALLGVCFDLFRAVRLIFPHNWLLTAVEDILFMGLYAVFLTAFASAAARGEMRFYYVIGNLIGFVLYLATVGSLFIRIAGKLFSAVKWIFRVATSPFRKCFALLRKKAESQFVGTAKIIVKPLKKVKMLLLNIPLLLYNKKANNKRKNVDYLGKKD